ncbi:uncharacterized protein [Diadema setosum]|uniref:uncharacterized protein n=1 Tax=Diadema setosum TaxID=31175 RepID=UPI003B3BD237
MPRHQALDPETGVWLSATVVSQTDESTKVKWTNYKGAFSHVATDEVRLALTKRVFEKDISKELWPNTQTPFSLTRGDFVQLLNVDGHRDAVIAVSTNDPFRGMITSEDRAGREYRYEHIAEPPPAAEHRQDDDVAGISDSDDADLDDAEVQVEPASSRKRTTFVKKKAAVIIAEADPADFQDNIPTSQLLPLTPEELTEGHVTLERQLESTEAPNFDLPTGMTQATLLQQNMDLIAENTRLREEARDTRAVITALEARMTMLERKVCVLEATQERGRREEGQRGGQRGEENDVEREAGDVVPPQVMNDLRLSPENVRRVAVQLAKEMFNEEERIDSCLARMDKQRVAEIQRNLWEICPTPARRRKQVWSMARKAIDMNTRYLRKCRRINGLDDAQRAEHRRRQRERAANRRRLARV